MTALFAECLGGNSAIMVRPAFVVEESQGDAVHTSKRLNQLISHTIYLNNYSRLKIILNLIPYPPV